VFDLYGGPNDEMETLGTVDFNVNLPQPAAVPEPATLLGFGVPMALVGFDRLRRKFAK
jgi:hypothetical protein